ncbi:MAG: hypothetical protein CVU46_00280 [Chloroflexi bacterium HGW-Chloroflexi-8]|nr:MAG: hypothetical protein CVU46_00280 [Chloroflexi bacterium HGW-Chloroflexi-8]
MVKKLKRLRLRVNQIITHTQNDQRIAKIAKGINKHAALANQSPIVFFNASTRIKGMSLNAGFSLLTAWILRLQGVPVVQFVCDAGMSYCMLGSILNNPTDKPPCSVCVAQSKKMYKNLDSRWVNFKPSLQVIEATKNLTIDELSNFHFEEMPLGDLVLPSLRWVLRRYHLTDNEETRLLFQQYIISAESIARQFSDFVKEIKPQKVIVFNGMSFPEAVVRWVSIQKSIPVITHEVGLQPFSAYFSNDQATAYPIQIPDSFSLSETQNTKLDEYLDLRFKGKFSMAGVKFWPTMKELSPSFLERAKKFKQIVPVFTNVIFDTSQSHANVIFDHMFDWLDCVLEVIIKHPETLFVIRAHPDEARPGKASNENVASWAKSHRIESHDNVVFVDATEHFSSYELIQKSKFVLIYNSTIGMEATVLGIPVISGGRSRFTQIPIVFFPDSKKAFVEKVEEFLTSNEIVIPQEFITNVRRFLYTQLYKVSLPFGEFLEEDHVWDGYVKIKDFSWDHLLPEKSVVAQTLVNGILKDERFEIDQ